MPVPSARSDLSTVAANNNPPGTESAKGNIDNYLRAHAGFIAQNYADLQTITTLLTGVAGTDTITGSATPDLTSAYAAGQCFRFVAAGANTGAVTLNIDGMGAKSVTKNGTTALAAGDIPSGAVCEVVYDGTRFQLLGVVGGADINLAAGKNIVFEGATDDAFETTFSGGDPTADRTITLPNASGNVVLDTATQTLTNKTINGGALQSGTVQNTTSGTAIDFTGIPSWVKRITVSLSGVSTTGSNPLLVQLGTSGGIVASGYAGVAGRFDGIGTASSAAVSNGLLIYAPVGSNDTIRATVTIVKHSVNTWVASHSGSANGTGVVIGGGGDVALGGTLDRLRLTTTTGTDTFDAGSVNIHYE